MTPELERRVSAGEPVELSQVFLPSLTDHAAVAAATIPVERIQGATLLISARDDRSWPSAALSEIAMSRFAQRRHPRPYRHITYQLASHLIAPPPYGPTTDTVMPGAGSDVCHWGEHHRITPQLALMPGHRRFNSLQNISRSSWERGHRNGKSMLYACVEKVSGDSETVEHSQWTAIQRDSSAKRCVNRQLAHYGDRREKASERV